MFHPRTHLTLIFCAIALMTLHSASAQNASSKIRFTNGLHGGVDIARSSMAMTDKHPLATYLGDVANIDSERTFKSFIKLALNLIHKPNIVESTHNIEFYTLYLPAFQLSVSPKDVEKLSDEFPFLRDLTAKEKLSLKQVDNSYSTTYKEMFYQMDPTRVQNFYPDNSQPQLQQSQKFDSLIDEKKLVYAKALIRYESRVHDPKNVNSLGYQTRVYGDETVNSLDYLYGNRHPSVDFGIQSFFGSSSGFGLGLRFPLFRIKGWNDSDMKLHSEDASSSEAVEKKLSFEMEVKKFDYINEQDQERYIRNIQHPAVAFVGGARTIDHIGQTYNAGVNFSILRELGKHGPSVELLASTQYFWFHSRLHDAQGVRVPSSEAARFGLGFAINDRMVEFKEDTDNKFKKKYYELKYWHWQAGAEYSFKNRLTEGDTVTGYLRNRDNGGNEYTLYAGVASNQGFFGLAFAKKFK